jgi:protein-L-isoaspartate(D-aspartate) O-methyltransferase
MTSATRTRPENLRNEMVQHIKKAGYLRCARIEQALQTVPRHQFVPAASMEDAYANKSITIKPGADRPASCISVPTVVAMMLGQLDLQPGDHVLEIGAGTGYNAALLAELVGPTGSVTTVDIHPDVIAHARRALEDTGYQRVHLVAGDGALGDPVRAPYDKIIVTVGPWDLPPAWINQLVPGGRLVVPLHWRGQARSIAFVRVDGGYLRAENSRLCGFIPMIGIVPSGERTGNIADKVALYSDTDQDVDPAALYDVLILPETTVWSSVYVEVNEPFDHVWLWLTATEQGTCRIAAEPSAIEAGVCRPAFAYRTPAIVEGDSLAYLTKPRPVDQLGKRRYQLGATCHGSAGADLAERLSEQIRRWDRDRAAQPIITAYPAGISDNDLPPNGVIIAKHHVRMVVSP